MTSRSGIVISASRMTDMPAWYPQALIEEVRLRMLRGQQIHTLVLWTKHPQVLFNEPFFSFLKETKERSVQLFLQLTITGMGGKDYGADAFGHPWKPEPGAPSPQSSLQLLPQIISFLGHPHRLLLRIDPLMKFKDSNGMLFSNVREFEPIATTAAKHGIQYFTFSLVQPGIYAKVDWRFEREGIELLPFTPEDQDQLKRQFHDLEKRLKIRISACNVEGWPTSACIDGELLMRLNPEGGAVSLKKPRSRPLCGCTYSVDIGGWPPKPCKTGCIYCYARPQR